MSVADALDDQRHRNVVDHEFKEFLGAFQLARQRFAIGHVFEHRDEEFRFPTLVSGDNALAGHRAGAGTAIDVHFIERIAVGRGGCPAICGGDRGGGMLGIDVVRALAENLLARDSHELLERAIGQDITAILDGLRGDTHRYVVNDGFQKLLGRRQLFREFALLAAILMGRDGAAVRQFEMPHCNRSAIRQFGDETFAGIRQSIELVVADVQRAARTAQIEQLGAGHSGRDIRSRQPIDLEIAVVAEDDPPMRIRHHDALIEIVQRRTDERVPAQMRTLDLAQRRHHPDDDRRQEGHDDEGTDENFPDQTGIGKGNVAGRRKTAVGSPGASRQRHGSGAQDASCSNRILAACLPILASHRPPEICGRSVWLHGFGSGKRLLLQPKKLSQIPANGLA